MAHNDYSVQTMGTAVIWGRACRRQSPRDEAVSHMAAIRPLGRELELPKSAVLRLPRRLYSACSLYHRRQRLYYGRLTRCDRLSPGSSDFTLPTLFLRSRMPRVGLLVQYVFLMDAVGFSLSALHSLSWPGNVATMEPTWPGHHRLRRLGAPSREDCGRRRQGFMFHACRQPSVACAACSDGGLLCRVHPYCPAQEQEDAGHGQQQLRSTQRPGESTAGLGAASRRAGGRRDGSGAKAGENAWRVLLRPLRLAAPAGVRRSADDYTASAASCVSQPVCNGTHEGSRQHSCTSRSVASEAAQRNVGQAGWMASSSAVLCSYSYSYSFPRQRRRAVPVPVHAPAAPAVANQTLQPACTQQPEGARRGWQA